MTALQQRTEHAIERWPHLRMNVASGPGTKAVANTNIAPTMAGDDGSLAFRWGCILPRWHDFQDLRFIRNQLWARLQTQRRTLNLPALGIKLRTCPVYSFAASARGVLHLIPRPVVTGGVGGCVLRCWTQQVPDAVVLHAEGEVDLTTASALADAIADVSVQNGHIIVDLSRLDYLDGSAIRVLAHAARRYHGRFIVVGSKPTVHRLFDILKLTNVLPVVPSVEAAFERLRGS